MSCPSVFPENLCWHRWRWSTSRPAILGDWAIGSSHNLEHKTSIPAELKKTFPHENCCELNWVNSNKLRQKKTSIGWYENQQVCENNLDSLLGFPFFVDPRVYDQFTPIYGHKWQLQRSYGVTSGIFHWRTKTHHQRQTLESGRYTQKRDDLLSHCPWQSVTFLFFFLPVRMTFWWSKSLVSLVKFPVRRRPCGRAGVKAVSSPSCGQVTLHHPQVTMCLWNSNRSPMVGLWHRPHDSKQMGLNHQGGRSNII